jgi:hypothetical protein
VLIDPNQTKCQQTFFYWHSCTGLIFLGYVRGAIRMVLLSITAGAGVCVCSSWCVTMPPPPTGTRSVGSQEQNAWGASSWLFFSTIQPNESNNTLRGHFWKKRLEVRGRDDGERWEKLMVCMLGPGGCWREDQLTPSEHTNNSSRDRKVRWGASSIFSKLFMLQFGGELRWFWCKECVWARNEWILGDRPNTVGSMPRWRLTWTYGCSMTP